MAMALMGECLVLVYLQPAVAAAALPAARDSAAVVAAVGVQVERGEHQVMGGPMAESVQLALRGLTR